MPTSIRIGSRASELSLWQARQAASLIQSHHPSLRVEIKTYRSRGDNLPKASLPAIGGAGIFTSTLESALQNDEIDCAVHSLKDMPTAAAKDLVIAAILKRGDHRDALVSQTGQPLDHLPRGARIGTGSPRRRAQLLRYRPDLRVCDIRGNVPTRIEKLMAADGPYDALVLAAAGLRRLGLEGHICQVFEAPVMLCAAGQGAIAIQSRAEQQNRYAPLTHRPTWLASQAERAFLQAMDAGCSMPVAALAHLEDTSLHLQGRVIAEDGKHCVDVRLTAALADNVSAIETARRLGHIAARQALADGADRLMNRPHPQAR